MREAGPWEHTHTVYGSELGAIWTGMGKHRLCLKGHVPLAPQTPHMDEGAQSEGHGAGLTKQEPHFRGASGPGIINHSSLP